MSVFVNLMILYFIYKKQHILLHGSAMNVKQYKQYALGSNETARSTINWKTFGVEPSAALDRGA